MSSAAQDLSSDATGSVVDGDISLRSLYAQSINHDDGATLDDLREAVETLVEIEPTARRVLGGAHPTVHLIETFLPDARVALRARETPSPSA